MLCDKKHSHVQWRDFKMNVLVCDDDQQIVDSIIEELKKKSEETHVALRFYGFSQPSQIDLSLPYDIALLDIDMGETNGIELARKLRAENENIVIIFITNFIQYAPEGFEVQAFRYLLKADGFRLITTCLLFIIAFLYAPVEAKNKRLPTEKKRKYRHISICLTGFDVILAAIDILPLSRFITIYYFSKWALIIFAVIPCLTRKFQR